MVWDSLSLRAVWRQLRNHCSRSWSWWVGAQLTVHFTVLEGRTELAHGADRHPQTGGHPSPTSSLSLPPHPPRNDRLCPQQHVSLALSPQQLAPQEYTRGLAQRGVKVVLWVAFNPPPPLVMKAVMTGTPRAVMQNRLICAPQPFCSGVPAVAADGRRHLHHAPAE